METEPAASGVTFGWQPIAEILDEPNLRELIEAYWEELSPLKDVAPLAPDFDQMMWLEDKGMHRVWTARSEEGLLIGFIGFHLCRHLNYRTTLFAMDSGHYLDPLCRNEDWTGVRMWRSALDALKEIGVRVVIAHDNAARPLDAFFIRLGFKPRSKLFWRAL